MSICKVFLQMCSQASRIFQNESSNLVFANPSPLLLQLPKNVFMHKSEHTNNLTLSNRTLITISNPSNISFYKKYRFLEKLKPLAPVLITSQNVNFVICNFPVSLANPNKILCAQNQLKEVTLSKF